MRKKLLRSALALIISVTILPLGSLVSYAGEETSNIDSKGIATEEITQSKYSEHIANGTLPSKNGYLFAGWYTDRTCADVLTRTEGAALSTDATVCAKFVDSDVLTVKAQVEIKEDGAKADIRFVTTVDSCDYQKIGFRITIEGREGVKIRESKKVYRHLYQIGEESENSLDVISPTLFSEASTFFCTYGFWNVPYTDFGVGFTVTPYWVTLDGTTVDGTTATKTVNGGYEYSGDWGFDTSYKYVCNSSFMYVSGTQGTDYEQPYVENGVLNLSLKTNTRTVCFSAADLIKEGYCVGDDVKVTVRMKPDNAEQFKIYTAPRGQGDSYINLLKDKVNADGEGWYTYTYETKINDKYSPYLYSDTSPTTEYANIGFSFMWNDNSYVGNVLFDYIKVQPVSDGWEFTNADSPMSSEISTNATTEIKDGHLKLSVTNTGVKEDTCWGFMSLSTQKLIDAGYQVGDKIQVTIRMKSATAGTIQFSGAASSNDWNSTCKNLTDGNAYTQDGEYCARTYETTISANKGSLWSDTQDTWNSIRFRFAFMNTAVGVTRDVEIDYIRVESIGDGWKFTDGDSPLSDEVSTNANTTTEIKDGHLKLSVTNTGATTATCWGFMSLSAQELIDAGYQVGDKIQVTIRMKSATAGTIQFSGAASSNDWNSTCKNLTDGNAYTQDGEYCTRTYETTISANKGSLWSDTTDTWNSLRFRFAFMGTVAGDTRNVEIDYIRVEKVAATE